MITTFNTRVTEVVLDPDPYGKSVTVSLQDTAFPQKKLSFRTMDFIPKWHVGQEIYAYLQREDDTSAVNPEIKDGKYLVSCMGTAMYTGIGKYGEFSADFLNKDQITTFNLSSGNEAWTNSIIINENYLLMMTVTL